MREASPVNSSIKTGAGPGSRLAQLVSSVEVEPAFPPQLVVLEGSSGRDGRRDDQI